MKQRALRAELTVEWPSGKKTILHFQDIGDRCPAGLTATLRARSDHRTSVTLCGPVVYTGGIDLSPLGKRRARRAMPSA